MTKYFKPLWRLILPLLLGALFFPFPLRAQDAGSASSGEDRLLDLETEVNTEKWRSQVQEKLEQAPLEPEAFSVTGARHPEKVSHAPAAIFAVGSQAIEKRISDPREIANAIKGLMYVVDAFWMIPDQTVISKESFRYFLETSIERKIPLFAFSGILVKGGALLALAPDYEGMGRQAGALALDLAIPPEILKTAAKTFQAGNRSGPPRF